MEQSRAETVMTMIALSDLDEPSPEAVLAAFRKDWPSLSTPELERSSDSFGFRVDAAHAAAVHIPKPIPRSDLEPACAATWMWPNAADALRTHQAHLIVAVFSDAAWSPRERLSFLTQATASMLAVLPAALGVYGRRILVPAMLFRTLAVEMLPDSVPLELWVNVQVGKNADGTLSGRTDGLEEFGLLEFETENAPATEPLRDRLIGIGHYVIENGPVIESGHTLGQDGNERISVTRTTSAFGNPNPVLRLDYETKRKRGLFKFF